MQTLEYGAREPPGGESTGIDINSIRQHFGPLGWRMPVDDDLAEIYRAFQKLITNPQKVIHTLAFQGLGRTPAWQKKYFPAMTEVFSEAKNLKCSSGTAAWSAVATCP